jgi:hypothetical protein
MIKAEKSSFFEKIFNFYNTKLLKKTFFKIHLKEVTGFEKRDRNIPTIIYCNHSNWWDGLILFYLSKNIWSADSYVMMEIEQLSKHKFFRKLGAFSVDKSSPQAAIKAIEYSVELLKNSGKTLFIFPQGKMLPNDVRPFQFYNGVIKIAEKLGEVNLFSLSFRYEFLMEQRPEVFLQLNQFFLQKNWNAKQLNGVLSDELTKNLDQVKSDILSANYSVYKTILTGKKSLDKK